MGRKKVAAGQNIPQKSMLAQNSSDSNNSYDDKFDEDDDDGAGDNKLTDLRKAMKKENYTAGKIV